LELTYSNKIDDQLKALDHTMLLPALSPQKPERYESAKRAAGHERISTLRYCKLSAAPQSRGKGTSEVSL